MGATYTRQSGSTIADGSVIEASHFNDEFDQLLAAFATSSGHTHDGTAAEGGPVTKLLGTAITIGDATAGTDIAITFDGESNDGVLTWMEDEDYFQFSDDLLLSSTEKLQFRDTAIYINSSTDGQLDLVADTEIQIAATTIDINGNVDVSGTLTVAGAVDFGDAALSNVGAVQLDSIAGDGDTNTSITFSGSDVITVATGGAGRLTIGDGALSPVTNNQIDLGTSSLEFKDAFFDGTVTADAFAGPLTGNVTGNASGTAATVTTAAQSNITSLGTLTTLTVDNVIINGSTIGHTGDTDLMTVASGVLTVAGEVDATSLDISGDADIDGTLEADAITIAGVTLAETIADTVGAMVTSNTESGITVAYQDADNTLDFTVGTLNQNTTGSAATLTTARTIGGTSFDGSANIAVGLAATATALASARTIGGTSFDGTGNIAVALASVGTAVTVADESSDTTCFPLFATAATGDLPPKSGSNLTFNSSSGLLTATLLAGDLTGDVTGNADTATLATTITATANNTTAETVYLAFLDGATGTQGIETDTGLTWNPNTNVLTAANVAGTVTTATQNSITTATGLVTTGALDTGSITSGFGTIDTGASAITTTGLITGGSSLLSTLGVITAKDLGVGVHIRTSDTSASVTGDADELVIENNASGGSAGLSILSNTDGYGTIAFGDSGDNNIGQIFYEHSNNKLYFYTNGAERLNISNAGLATFAGEVQMTTLDIGGTNVSATAAEINYSDLATLGTTAASKVFSADANNLTAISGAVVLTEDTLSFDATQDWDVRASPVAKVTLTANVTFDAPTNPTTGQYISILCIQDAGGTNTIAWNAVFEFTGDTAPTATTTGARGDLFTFRYNGAKWLEVGRNLNLVLS
jgi:cytoskeletal protein CcmA (bactofilin family)